MCKRFYPLKKSRERSLEFCQVKHFVFALSVTDNIALDMPDYTSAVDGNLKSCYSTADSSEPWWWRVDLLRVRPVAVVRITSSKVEATFEVTVSKSWENIYGVLMKYNIITID